MHRLWTTDPSSKDTARQDWALSLSYGTDITELLLWRPRHPVCIVLCLRWLIFKHFRLQRIFLESYACRTSNDSSGLAEVILPSFLAGYECSRIPSCSGTPHTHVSAICFWPDDETTEKGLLITNAVATVLWIVALPRFTRPRPDSVFERHQCLHSKPACFWLIHLIITWETS